MSAREDRLYKIHRLHLWFAVSSLMMTASIVWMVWVDYDRPWRLFQDRYFAGKSALAHLDYLDAVRRERVDEIEEARQRLVDAQEYVASALGSQRQTLVAELSEAELEFKKTDAPWRRMTQNLELTRDAYERVVERHGPAHSLTQASYQQLQTEEEEEERKGNERERREDKKNRLRRQLDQLNEPIRKARKRLTDLENVARVAREKDRQFRGVLTDEGILGGMPIVSAVINASLGDSTASETAPERHRVRQLVLPDVRQRLNYLDSYTTDRCITCHVAIDDPEFSKDRLAKKLERSLPGINEALQRMGESPSVPPDPPVAQSVGEALPRGHVTEHWEEITSEQQDAYLGELLGRVNNYLTLSGRRTIDLDQPLLAHPDLDLYLSVDSPHPMAKVGCTVCHEGNPQETDFILAAHSPPTHEVEKEWKEDYYIRTWGVPNATFETVSHCWDRPMHVPEHTEAGCAKCHPQITDIARFEGRRHGNRINLGRYLFTILGCANCHNVARLAATQRIAPDLTHVASKLTPAFVQAWIYSPRELRPTTLMPHFFQQENNRAESAKQFDEHPVVRIETETAAMSKYLFSVSREWHPTERPAEVTLKNEDFRQGEFEMNAQRAEMADDLIFMLLNSQRSGRRTREIMQDVGDELTEMVVALLQSSLGRQEAYDLIRPMTLGDKKLMYVGNKMISHYGCYACHTIPGFESATPPGTDLSEWGEKPVTKLDFAFYDHAFHEMREGQEDVFGYIYPPDADELNHWSPTADLATEQIMYTRAAFATHKMLNPRIWDRGKIKRPYDKLKMPNFYFTEDEADALTVFLLSRVEPRVSADLTVDYDEGEESDE
ncbi:MAG: hypothetical protein ACYTFA_08885 [Planctomycetota bacterium]|jgi:cbb3-type cytochrome oxidase cytochrome c subunit